MAYGPSNHEKPILHVQQEERELPRPNTHPGTHTHPCLECQHTWKAEGIEYIGTDLKVVHGTVAPQSDSWEYDTTCGWSARPKEDM